MPRFQVTQYGQGERSFVVEADSAQEAVDKVNADTDAELEVDDFFVSWGDASEASEIS